MVYTKIDDGAINLENLARVNSEGVVYYLSFVAAITLVAMAILLVSHAMEKEDDTRAFTLPVLRL